MKRFAALGADGIVIGVLTPEGDLDEERMAKLISLAGGCGVTLHPLGFLTAIPEHVKKSFP